MHLFKWIFLLIVLLLAGCSLFDSGSGSGNDLPEAIHPVLVNGNWGYIRQDASLAVAPRYQDARFPVNGYAAVRQGILWGYIQASTGAEAIAPQFSIAGEFGDGLAPVRPASGGGYGYINALGEFIVPPLFQAANVFSEGRAAVLNDGLWGYIDTRGETVIPFQFSQAGRFSQGLAAVQGVDGWQYITLSGDIAFTPPFRIAAAGTFADGLAPVQTSEGWGYINQTGALTIPVRYTEAYAFSEGLSRVRVGNYYGFIRPNGDMAIEPQFDEARDVREGMIAVRLGTNWFYVRSRDGNMAFIPPDATSDAADFRSGLGRVRIGSADDPRFAYLDASGTYIWAPTR